MPVSLAYMGGVKEMNGWIYIPSLLSCFIFLYVLLKKLELNQEYTYLDAYLLFSLLILHNGAITRIFTMNFPYFSSVTIHSSCLFFTCATYYLPGQFPKSVICIFLLFGWAGIPSTHNVTLLKCSNLLLIYKGVISTHICSFSFLELH